MVVVSSVRLLPPSICSSCSSSSASFPPQRGLCLVVRATRTRNYNNPRKGSPSSSSTGRKKLSKTNTNTNPNKLKARTSKKSVEFPTLRSVSRGETATTYTRLPPRDDYLVLTPELEKTPIFEEVTFFDLTKNKQFSLDDEYTSGAGNVEVGDEEVEEEEEEKFLYENIGFDYGEFESFSGDGPLTEGGEKNVEDDDYDEEVMEGFESDDGTTMVESSSGSGFVDGEEGFEEGEEKEEKEKGVPAVMRCFDRAKIFVKAGNGGNGVVAFRREKYVPHGGPSGGDGGKGGNIYVEVDGSMNSLLPFRKNIHFRAGRGSHGQGSKQAGAKGENVVVMVAPGTVIREAGKDGEEGNVLLELLHPGQRALLLPGGRGGRGNASFKSGTNKVPRIAEIGEEGAEMWLELELKLVADVGIVGAPNAGKSTLLSVTSAAQPTIANYPFTTLLPNLGVVSFDYDSTMVVADLPGLLEGAHRGFGLGHEFLRHTERCSVLVHVVDGSGQQPEYEFDAVRLELELFNPELSVKPFVVAFNKMDLPEAYEKWISFKEHLEAQGIKPFCMSAVNRQGTNEVISAAYQLLRNEQEAEKNTEGWTEPLNINHVAERVHKQRNASINDFEISHDSDSSSWYVVGAGIQRFVQMTNWNYSESMKRFQHVLEACGVNKSLIKLGVKEGDRVIVGEMEMIWHDKNDNFGSKRSTGSVKWPQFSK